MIKTVIMGTGRMGSLIRTTAEAVVDAAGEPVFDIVAQIGFDLSELESAPAADVIIDFSNVVTFDAVVAYVERTGAALVSPQSYCSTPSSRPSPKQATIPSMAARVCAEHATPRRSACTRCAVALSPACTK